MQTDLSCPQCNKPFVDLREAGFTHEPPSLGDILLCGSCACVSALSLEGPVPLSELEFAALSVDEKRDLTFAVRNILAAENRSGRIVQLQPFLHSPE